MYETVRQDVRRELGRGHRLDRDLSELQRLADRLEEPQALGGRKLRAESREHWQLARDIEDGLRDHGLPDLGDHLVREASRHHPDSLQHAPKRADDFDFTGGGL